MTKSTENDSARAAMAREALTLLKDKEMEPLLAQVNSAAIRTLLGAVQRAASLEEIEIVFRYQQARDHQNQWGSKLVEKILELLQQAAGPASNSPTAREDRARVKRATEQLSLIARVHRVAIEKKGGEAADHANK